MNNEKDCMNIKLGHLDFEQYVYNFIQGLSIVYCGFLMCNGYPVSGCLLPVSKFLKRLQESLAKALNF